MFPEIQLSKKNQNLYKKLILVGVLLLATFFRWHSLEAMSAMLHHDEAYNGLDALRLAADPHLTVFFPDNFGREAGWFYWLLPFVYITGAHPIALRLGATFMGILGVAATFRLGRETLGEKGGLWAALVLSILYWHVHLSTLGLRAIMMPFVGAMAFSFLLRAHQNNKFRYWIGAGVWFGFLTYTYFSARSWLLLALIILTWWFIRDRKQRKNILFTISTMGFLALPLVIYSLQNPSSLDRFEEVGVFSIDTIFANIHVWSQAWFKLGDQSALFNLPGRPILDPFLGILFLVGLINLPFIVRKREHFIWILALLLFGILPSIFSEFAPHFLRAIGTTIPVALIIASGARGIESIVKRNIQSKLAAFIPFLLITTAGFLSFRAFHETWVKSSDIYMTMEHHITKAIRIIDKEIEPDNIVYFSPFMLDHPNIRFHEPILNNYQVGAFDSNQCLIIADDPAFYMSLDFYAPSFTERMRPFADLEMYYKDEVNWIEEKVFAIYQVTPHEIQAYNTAIFDNQLQVEILTPITQTVKPSDQLPIQLRIRALRQMDKHYNIFVHLYPVSLEDEYTLVSQADKKICSSYPTPSWKLNESIIETISLTIPEQLVAGEYLIVLGIYESWPPYTRLSILDKAEPNDFLLLGTMFVSANSTENQ